MDKTREDIEMELPNTTPRDVVPPHRTGRWVDFRSRPNTGDPM